MSTENIENVSAVEDDLDAFAADFFGQKEAQSEPASSEKDETDNKEDVPSDETDDNKTEDTHEGDDDTPNDEDDNNEDDDEGKQEEEDSNEPKPKPKKSRAQERIEELNKKYRETERQLNELREKFEKQNTETNKPAVKEAEVTGPEPSDQNEDGTDKYPLGEFDPNYIRDLTKFTLEQERQAAKAQDEQAQAQKVMEEQRAELQAGWNEKLGPAQERYPDFREKGEELIDTFSDLNQDYAEYLTATLMSMDYGPDVLYYLANNPDEAHKIVNGGPTKATIALGRLESKFADAAEEKQKARPKVSQAPTPPPVNKGAAPAKTVVSPDTDDLDAFSKEFFKKK